MKQERAGASPRRSVWTAKAGVIIGLVAFVLIVRLLVPVLPGGGRHASLAVGLGLAVIPAALWFILFYLYDTKEHEPLTYVLEVAIAGGLLAGAVAIPVVRGIYDAARWLYAGPAFALLGSICVVGAVQEFCKYLAIRYTVFEVDEFDEVADGIAYGHAAGLGVATVLNLWFVLNSPGVSALPGTLRIVVTALAHASFGAVIGYFLGRAKVYGQDSGVVWGFLAATVLNGLVTYFLGTLTRSGLTYHPWNGLILAAGVAIAVTALLSQMVRPPKAAAAP